MLTYSIELVSIKTDLGKTRLQKFGNNDPAPMCLK